MKLRLPTVEEVVIGGMALAIIYMMVYALCTSPFHFAPALTK